MPVPLRRPSRLALLALLTATVGVALLALSSPPAAAQAKAPTVSGTAQFKWEPANVTIKPGGSVTFKVASGPPHPVESGDGSNPNGDGRFDSSACQIAKMSTVGASCTVKFPKAGTFPFFCQTHVSLGMKGVIQVGAGGAQPTTTAAVATAPATTTMRMKRLSPGGSAAGVVPAVTRRAPGCGAAWMLRRKWSRPGRSVRGRGGRRRGGAPRCARPWGPGAPASPRAGGGRGAAPGLPHGGGAAATREPR